jgi:hypothetical protein
MMELLLCLKKFAAASLADMSFEARGGENLPAPNVWVGDLPGKKEKPGKEDFPFVLIELLDVEDDLDGGRPSVETVRLLVGTWAGPTETSIDVSPAYHDLLNALSRLRRSLLVSPVLGRRWAVAGKVVVSLYPEQSYPYYFGSLAAAFETRRPDGGLPDTKSMEVGGDGGAYGNGY